MSTSGAPFDTRALARRSRVPPTSNSTGIPVLAVNGLATIRSTVSFQFPPHTLTTIGSAATATAGTIASTSTASQHAKRRRCIDALLLRQVDEKGPDARRRRKGRLRRGPATSQGGPTEPTKQMGPYHRPK